MKTTTPHRSRGSNKFLVPSALYALLLVIMFWGEGRASAQHPVADSSSGNAVITQKAISPIPASSGFRVSPLPSLASAHAPSAMKMQPSGILVGLAGLMMLMIRAGRSWRHERTLSRPLKQA